MKKLLLTEGILACLFLAVLFGIFGKVSGWEKDTLEVNSKVYEEEQRKKDTLWLYPGKLNSVFSPLQYQTTGEQSVIAMCFSNLLLRDEEGKRCNHPITASWKEEEQFAHISYYQDKQNNVCHVTIAVNPKAKTIFGDVVDADDILFNYYLRADASGKLVQPFGNVQILGQEEFFYGSDDISGRKKEISSMIKKPSKELLKRWSEEIIREELTKEFQWVKSLYRDDAYQQLCSQYSQPKDLFAYYFAYQTKYSSKGKSESQVFSEILQQFHGDYRRLSKITGENYRAKAEQIALSLLLQQQGKDEVKSIKGIRKLDSHTVEIAVSGNHDCIDTLCNIWILPLSQYGDEKLFDGKEYFGFQKGNANQILKQAQEKFAGSGAYYRKRNKNQKMVFCRNPYYFGKKPQIKEVTILKKEYTDYQKVVQDLLNQEVDLVFLQDSEELEKLLQNRATRANSRIRKVKFTTTQMENCFVYRTSCINTPSIPRKISEYCPLLQQLNHLKTNSRRQ